MTTESFSILQSLRFYNFNLSNIGRGSGGAVGCYLLLLGPMLSEPQPMNSVHNHGHLCQMPRMGLVFVRLLVDPLLRVGETSPWASRHRSL